VSAALESGAEPYRPRSSLRLSAPYSMEGSVVWITIL